MNTDVNQKNAGGESDARTRRYMQSHQTDYRTALYTVMSTDRDLNRCYAKESLIMAAPRRSRNFARMLGRSYAKAYVPDRPNVRDAFLIQHTDGSSHRSSEPCGICRRPRPITRPVSHWTKMTAFSSATWATRELSLRLSKRRPRLSSRRPKDLRLQCPRAETRPESSSRSVLSAT